MIVEEIVYSTVLYIPREVCHFIRNVDCCALKMSCARLMWPGYTMQLWREAVIVVTTEKMLGDEKFCEGIKSCREFYKSR